MSSDPLLYRIATASDAAQLAALINRAFRSEPTGQTWLFDSQDKRVDIFPVALAEEVIAADDCTMLLGLALGESGDRAALAADAPAVATCFVRKPSVPTRDYMTDGAAWLSFLAVDPLSHRRGCGSAMLRHAEHYVQQNWGVHRLEMDYVNKRLELGAWYRRCGYNETGKRREFPYGEHGREILASGLETLVIGKDLRLNQ